MSIQDMHCPMAHAALAIVCFTVRSVASSGNVPSGRRAKRIHIGIDHGKSCQSNCGNISCIDGGD
ncbi:MAG: hypothetical protein HYT94_05105 [Parcubacteria group bacterium]|nr:hypothetical protein [Parcubacteria group bacterium]